MSLQAVAYSPTHPALVSSLPLLLCITSTFPDPNTDHSVGLSPHIAVCPLGISESVSQNPQVQVRPLIEEGPSSSPGPSPGQKTLSWVPQAEAGYAEGELSG